MSRNRFNGESFVQNATYNDSQNILDPILTLVFMRNRTLHEKFSF